MFACMLNMKMARKALWNANSYWVVREESSISKHPRSFVIGRKLATSVGDGWDGMEGMQRRARGGDPRAPRMRETGGPGTHWDSLGSGELMTSPQGK